MGVDNDGSLHHIGKGEDVEVRVGLDVVFTACLLPLGECLQGMVTCVETHMHTLLTGLAPETTPLDISSLQRS